MATGGQVESWSDEYIEYPCSVCEKDKKLSDSGHYCLSCKGFICVNCLSGHNKYTNDHQVLAVTEKKFQKLLTESCVDHPDEVIEHYCGDHDKLLCNTCERLSHRTCQNVKQISENVDNLTADQKLRVVPDQIKSTIDRVSKAMDSIDIYVDHVQKKVHTYLKDLDDYEQTLIAKIRALTAKGRNNITLAQNQIISAANERRKECVESKEVMNNCLEELKRSHKRKAHLVILKKKGQGIVNRAEQMCKESENWIKNRPFIFRPDTQIVESLNGFSSLVKEIKLYTHGQRSDINLKLSDDKEDCNIVGSCRLGDGTLVLCDYQNKRLKRVDPSTNNVIEHLNMKEEPWGLCSIGPQEIAVADCSNIVHIISAVKGLTPSRTVDMGQDTSMLACHGGELFAGRLDSLRIHDMSGIMIRDISRDTDGQSMFSRITGIAVNQAGDRVFVSDWSNGLVCVSRDGRVVFRLSNADMGLSLARGVTTDHRGSVMVAGALTHNVVQVTEEGRVVGEILAGKDGICSPKCLCYDVDGRKLYVGGSQLLGFELLWRVDVKQLCLNGGII